MNDREDDRGADADDDDRGLSRATNAAQNDLSELVDSAPVDEDEQTEDDMFDSTRRNSTSSV